MLEVKNISFQFSTSTPLLFQNLSIDLQKGEVLSILGRNGIGKTTLLKCILGFYQNYTGDIITVKSIGYVPQKIFVTFDMSVLEMIAMGRMPHLGFFGMPEKKDYKIAQEKANQLSITNLLDKSFMMLSGGQKQLVLIARALCVEPQMIIFDEPMSALDYLNQDHVLRIIKMIAKDNNVSVIFTTHYPTHAIHISDKTLLMRDASTYYFGKTKDILVDDTLQAVYDMPLVVQTLHNNTCIVPLFSS